MHVKVETKVMEARRSWIQHGRAGCDNRTEGSKHVSGLSQIVLNQVHAPDRTAARDGKVPTKDLEGNTDSVRLDVAFIHQRS